MSTVLPQLHVAIAPVVTRMQQKMLAKDALPVSMVDLVNSGPHETGNVNTHDICMDYKNQPQDKPSCW